MASPRYQRAHQDERRRWAPEVEAGLVACARCAGPIEPGAPWDLGHVDGGGPTDWAGPEHRACNRAVWRNRERAQLDVIRPGPSRAW